MIGTNHFLPENLLPYLRPLPLPKDLKTPILWDLMLWTYNSMQLVPPPTETAAKILSRQKIRFPVIPISCGVDIQLFHPGETDEREIICSEFGIDPQKTIFLYVGRHDKEKRIDLLLKGLALLHDRDLQTSCWSWPDREQRGLN
jgi:glycosyltransferase involved in cell wall biosynthesis